MDLLRSLASRMNQGCCASYSLDVPALAQALQADSVLSAWWPHRQETHAHLFSNAGLFVDASQLKAMRQAVQVLHETMHLPEWQAQALDCAPQMARMASGPRGVFMGYDFHLTEDGPRLIEINTNAGGAMLSLALARAQRACCDAMRVWMHAATDLDDLEQRWLAMFAQEWALQRGNEPFVSAEGAPRVLAIVDQNPPAQYLYPEFLLFQQMFARAGVVAVIAAPQDLSWNDRQLQHQGRRVDMVYLRLTDFDLGRPEHAHLQQAWATGACVFTPGPQAHALQANKRHLVALSDADFLVQLGLPASMREVLTQVVPRTLLLTSANADRLWEERKRYFFKPLAGYGSKAAYRGDKLTRKTWAQMQQSAYVAQELVPPSQRVVTVDAHARTLKADVRAYAYAGQVQLFAARLYDGQTTNFRSEGGGFAPVFVTPS